MPEVNYFWDEIEDNVIEEYDENGNTIVEYTTEPTLYGAVLSQDRGGQVRHYHYDGESNTISLTDENCNTTDTFGYSAFGEVTARTGSTPTRFQYRGAQGYYWDSDIGQFIVRARPLSAEVGRWLAADPTGFVDGLNLYTYVHNRATQLSDPSGHQVVGLIPCTLELCGECLNKALGPKGDGGDEIVNRLIYLLKNLAKKEPSCNFDINCCGPNSKDPRCEPCNLPFSSLRGQLLDLTVNKKYGGQSQIILCSKAFTIFTPNAPAPFKDFSRCQDVVETIRQELLHLVDRCSGVDVKNDKCADCICDELRGHFYSGQCKPGSVWWVIKGGRQKPFESVVDCLTWSAANSCLGACGAKAAEDLVAKVKAIYGTCKSSPAFVDDPLPSLE